MMVYQWLYQSVVGPLYLTVENDSLTRLDYTPPKDWNKKEQSAQLDQTKQPLFQAINEWLDRYFEGKQSQVEVQLAPKGTPFQQEVWKIIQEIPYGETMTYGEIAQRMAKQMGKEKMSAQAVGGAVGKNPLSIIIPCHRVIGKSGNITGYGGGIKRKLTLLALEQVAPEIYHVPENQKEASKFVESIVFMKNT